MFKIPSSSKFPFIKSGSCERAESSHRQGFSQSLTSKALVLYGEYIRIAKLIELTYPYVSLCLSADNLLPPPSP